MLKVSFCKHTIPNTALSAITENRIYYIDSNKLFFYNIQSAESLELLQVGKVTNLLMYKNKLVIISGNRVSLYRQGECSVIFIKSFLLNDIPKRIRCFDDGLIFLYDESVEIFTNKLYEIPGKILDICINKDASYVLSVDQNVYECPNIFIAKYITLGRPLNKSQGEYSIEYMNGIYYNNGIVLSNGEVTEKYHVCNSTLFLDYSFTYTGRVKDGMVCGKETIELGKAPFLCISDEIEEYKSFGSGGIGLSGSRIYFIEEEMKECKNSVSLEGSIFEISTVNKDSIKIPSCIRDEDAMNKYLDVEAGLARYEILYTKLVEYSKGFEAREEEVLRMGDEIVRKGKELEERAEKIRERIRMLEEKASRIKKDGEVKEFYEKMRRLQKLLDGFHGNRFEAYKKRLLIQKHVLQSKVD